MSYLLLPSSQSPLQEEMTFLHEKPFSSAPGFVCPLRDFVVVQLSNGKHLLDELHMYGARHLCALTDCSAFPHACSEGQRNLQTFGAAQVTVETESWGLSAPLRFQKRTAMAAEHPAPAPSPCPARG